jgi:serine/threonine protein kinase
MDDGRGQRRQRVDELFAEVLQRLAPERETFLREATLGDAALYTEIQTRLRTHATAGSSVGGEEASALLQPILADLSRLIDGEQRPLPCGGRIGVYRLIEEAGRGGMATVYLAEREVSGIQQRVALKLMDRGTDSDEVLRRFAHETRVLASLQHPNIARFYDAGATEDGRPYLVMEYIEGRPLTEYCDAARLAIEARLDLFGIVCGAVQYAHQNLVVHRDIKPSNIMVTDRGEVKLLDFGIAKLVAEEIDPAAPLTRTGLRVLTPEYAAPEQIRGEQIRTATDVYALGVVLYELLCGSRPGSGTADARLGDRLDRSIEPPSPSAIVRRRTRTAPDTAAVAAARSTTTDRLRRSIEGDLDRIVLRALEHEPAQRYQSPQQLQDDLDRHARGLPVQARPATMRYRLRKYARRHRAGILGTAAALLVLVGFTAFHTQRITGERDRAQAEAAKSRVTTHFLQRLLAEAYPSVTLGDTLFSMSALLERAVARVDSVTDQPGIQAELLRSLGDVYREQGRFEQALALLQRAVALHRGSGEPPSRAAGEALSALGHLQYERHDYEAAWQDHAASLEMWQQVFAADDTLVLYALNNMAAAASALERYDESLRLHQQVLARRRRMFADTSRLVHTTHNNLGHLHHRMGNLTDAEREHREALRMRRAGLPSDHPSIALSMNNLASTLDRRGKLEEAEQLHREALASFQRVFGPDHHRVGLAAYNLGLLLHKKGALAEAESLFRLALSIDRKTYGDQHLEVGTDLRVLGSLLREAGDCASAEPTLREADAIFERNDVPLGNRRRVMTRSDLGACLGTLGRYAEAEEMLIGTYHAARALDAQADSAAIRQAVERLADFYRVRGRSAEAELVGRRTNTTN